MKPHTEEGQEGEMTGRRDEDEGVLIIGHVCSAQLGLILTTRLLIFFPSYCQSR